jgi:hypothetical protein
VLDAVVYPVRAVINEANERFVALRLDHADPHVRPLQVVWLPTVLIADGRGNVQYRNVNSVPPAEFLDVLDLGETMVCLREAQYERAVDRLASLLGRRDDGPLHDEARYWLGVAGYYRGGHDGDARDQAWAELAARHPDSIWTKRIPS